MGPFSVYDSLENSEDRVEDEHDDRTFELLVFTIDVGRPLRRRLVE